ncbi:hypothetical protein RQP46_008605 [Phenoliferia psychrophenolica]
MAVALPPEAKDAPSAGSTLTERRVRPTGPMRAHARAFVTVTKLAVLLIFTFWIASLWLYGSLWQTGPRTHHLKILVADFDGGEIGQALLAATAEMADRPTLPHFEVVDPATTSPLELQHRVWKGDVWAAIYANANSSQTLFTALSSESAAASYSAAGALSYTGLEVRYTTTWAGILQPSLVALEAATLSSFNSRTLAGLLPTLNVSNFGLSQAGVLFHPISSTFINQAPFDFGPRVVFQTIGMVLPILMQFFLLAGMNGAFHALELYRGTSLGHLMFGRVVAPVWTLVASLAFSMITFDLFDAATTYLPMPFHAPLIVLYIVLNVASDVNPIEITNAFFRVHYAFPVHITWSLMMTICRSAHFGGRGVC